MPLRKKPLDFEALKKIKKSTEAFKTLSLNSQSLLMTVNILSLKLAGHRVHNYASIGQVHLES